MNSAKFAAAILHTTKYGESRLIIDMFTQQAGRMACVAQMPKSPRGKLKKQYFQPMTLLEIEADVRQNQQLHPLKDARLLVPYASIPFEPDKMALTMFTAEFLYRALRDEQQGEPLFSYIADSMQWLDTATGGYANFHLTFLMHMSRFLGFFPNLSGYADGDVFDMRTATFSHSVPTHSDFLDRNDARRLLQLMRMDFPTMGLFRLSHDDRNSITDVLLRYYALHIPQFGTMKSTAVLQEVFRQ